MKKSILLLSIPALIMAASCTSEETVDAPSLKEKAIAFAPNLQRTSRGTAQEIAPFTPENFKEFYAYAFSNDPGHNTVNFFSDCTFSKVDGSWDHYGDNVYYFPDWRLKFVAFAPADRYELMGSTQIGQGSRYRFHPDITPQKQQLKGIQLSFFRDLDLIVAANGKRNLQLDSKVKMTFKHALTKFTIKVKQTNPALRFEVNGAGIGGALDGGTFTYPDCTDKEEITVTQSCWSFTNSDSHPNFYVTNENENPLILNGNGQALTVGSGLIFPQNTTKKGYWTGGKADDGLFIYVSCKILQKSGNNEFNTILFPNEGSSDYAIAVPLKFDLQPGYHYTFTVDITNGGKKKPTSEGSNGGDPVLNGVITYGVTSAVWDVADTDLNL